MVYDNYQLFLQACQGVQDLEEKVNLLRNFVNGSTSLINNLKQTKGFSKQVRAGVHVLQSPAVLPCYGATSRPSTHAACQLLHTAHASTGV